MSIQGQCEMCEALVPDEKLLYVTVLKHLICPACANEYILDLKYDRDRYRNDLDNIRLAVTQYLQ